MSYNKMKKKFLSLTALASVAILALAVTSGEARIKSDNLKLPYQTPTVAVEPLEMLRVHNVGNMWLSITNYGIFGSFTRGFRDECTGQLAPSCQFPAGSGVEYLFQGALWIGAVVNDTDTLVSVGHDGWESVQELHPSETGAIVSRSIRPQGIQYGTCFYPYSDSAISELDHIAVYYDTITNVGITSPDPFDGAHEPLFIEVTQKSYSWSYDYAKDFVLLDYFVKNMSASKLNNLYMGIYIDADVHNPDNDPGGFTDDICGFRLAVPSLAGPQYEDTINVAWITDNDGLSLSGVEGRPPVFVDNASPTGVTGTRVVRSPNRDLKFSFNWWVSQSNPALDFGPWTDSSFARRPELFPPGVEGTPSSDRGKYFIMSNNEFDYDQLFAALDWTGKGWKAPNNPVNMCNIADGYDTRYLLSFGPFSIKPGDTLPLTLGYVAGADFHVAPTDFASYNCVDSVAAYGFYNKLDFTAFAVNAIWVSWVYDNPGKDTDPTDSIPCDCSIPSSPCKCRIIGGDTIYYTGDGVPDFKGPPPPPAPELTFESQSGRVKVKWNGRVTEETLDPFTNQADFEGYRVLLSRTGIINDYALLDSYDKLDYRLHYWDKGRKKWVYKLPSLTVDSLISLFEQDDPCGGARPCPLESLAFCLDPNNCSEADLLRWTQKHPFVYQGTQIDPLVISPNLQIKAGDSLFFDNQDWNQGLIPLKTLYKDTLDAQGDSDPVKLARRDSLLAGLIGPTDDRYFDYEYDIPGLAPSQPVHIAVTTFDFGDPLSNLSALETSVLSNSKLIYPIDTPERAVALHQKVKVYPNPYKVTENYINFPGSGDDPSLPAGRKVHFFNLPPNYTIKIFTLDGDEIVTIKQGQPRTNNCAADLNKTDGEDTWCLLSNNSQAVVSGIYLYTVEAPGTKTQVGKLVIIK